MPNIDYSHFNKFIASMGLILIATAFAMPWLFSQSTAVLTIPEDELGELTEVARATIHERQSALATFQEQAFPVVSICLLAIGVSALAFGLIRWSGRQKLRDSDEDYDLAAKRGAFEMATDEEVENKVREEASSEETSLPATAEANNESSSRAALSRTSPSEPAPSRVDRIALLRERESELERKVREAFAAEFNVNRDVRLVSESGPRFVIDLLLDPVRDASWSQLAIDLRFVRGKMFPLHLAEIVMRTAMATNDLRGGFVYSGRPGRPANAKTTALNIFVIDDEDDHFDRKVSRAREYLRTMNIVLKRPVGSVIMTAAKFKKISSSDLRDAISSSWKSGDTVLID